MTYSWAGRLFAAAAVVSGYKRFYSNDKMLNIYMAYRKKANNKPRRRRVFGRMTHAVKSRAHGMEIFTRSSDSSNGPIVLYLHGSGYVMQPTVFHWRFFDRLARNLDAEIIMPIYPKAPAHHFNETFDRLIACYADLLKRTEAEQIVFIGDSSGGAIALALTQEIVKRKMPEPAKLILIAPLLDSTLSRAGIEELERTDLLQTRKVLKRFGEAWAGGESLDHPLVSPMYGSTDSLPPISMFIGTQDMLLPDIRAFAAILQGEGREVELFEYERMMHDFVLLPIPEAEDAMAKIVQICGGNKGGEAVKETRELCTYTSGSENRGN